MEYTLNGKTYELKEVTFREVVKMEKCGVDLMTLGKKNTMTQIGAMVSYITGLSFDKALDEIDAHIQNGGTLDDVTKCLTYLADSDFFKQAGAKKRK